MCVAAIAWQTDPRWPLVAIGNRDEFHQRPTAPLARWDSGIVAGRDLQAGGTWLGVSGGRFGLVTNLRVAGYPRPGLATRGSLVTDWLLGQEPRAPGTMNPFNLWLAEPDRLRFLTNHPHEEASDLAPGLHGLSNGPRGDRWFKTARLETALGNWLAGDTESHALFAVLADATTETSDPEDVFSSVFIRHPDYGTRCSTVVTVDAEGNGRIAEQRFDAGGAPAGRTALGFTWA